MPACLEAPRYDEHPPPSPDSQVHALHRIWRACSAACVNWKVASNSSASWRCLGGLPSGPLCPIWLPVPPTAACAPKQAPVPLCAPLRSLCSLCPTCWLTPRDLRACIFDAKLCPNMAVHGRRCYVWGTTAMAGATREGQQGSKSNYLKRSHACTLMHQTHVRPVPTT